MKKKPKTRWKWGLLTIVSLAAIIGGPFIINECYKSNTGYMTRWNAADVLAYYGTILAAAGAVGGVFLSLKYSHKQYREDKRRDVLPYFSVNILERNCINPLYRGFDEDEEPQDTTEYSSTYKEYLPDRFFFLVSNSGLKYAKSLSREQLDSRKFSPSDEDNEEYGELCENNTSYIPVEITNVGKGCAINVTVIIDSPSQKEGASSTALSIPVGGKLYVGVFFHLNEEFDKGYLLKIRYSDIYKNLYEHRKTISVTTNKRKGIIQFAPETTHRLVEAANE